MTERGRGACRSVCSLLASWYPLPCGPAGAVPHPPPPLPTPGRKQMHPHGELRGVLAGPGSSRKSSQTPRFLFSTEKWGNPLYPGGRRLLGCMGRMAQLSTGHGPASGPLSRCPGRTLPLPSWERPARPRPPCRPAPPHRNPQESASFLLHWGAGRGMETHTTCKKQSKPRRAEGQRAPTPPALKATRGTNHHLPSPPRGARKEPAAEKSQARNSENPSEA